MTKKKKTWAESHDFTAQKSDGLVTYIQVAIHNTCRRLAWDWSLERETSTFAKIEAFLPSGYNDAHLLEVHVLCDTETVGMLCQADADVLGFATKERQSEANHFIKALYAEVWRLLDQWAMNQPNAKLAEQRAYWLFTGKEKPSSQPQATTKQKEEPQPAVLPTRVALEKQLTWIEQQIQVAVHKIRDEGMTPTGEAIAARLPLNPKGTPYTRETVSRKLAAMRRRGVDV